jgi:hypothetical protein
LHIDHINNDGAKFRKLYKGPIWLWIIKNNFPKDLQVLCQMHNEHKKRAYLEGITLNKWEENFNNKINNIKKLKGQGLSYYKISKILNLTLYNTINLYKRYK